MMTLSEALSTFRRHGHELTTLDAGGLATARRDLARIFHPDRGGNPAVMAEVNAAYDLLAPLVMSSLHRMYELRSYKGVRFGPSQKIATTPDRLSLLSALLNESTGAIFASTSSQPGMLLLIRLEGKVINPPLPLRYRGANPLRDPMFRLSLPLTLSLVRKALAGA